MKSDIGTLGGSVVLLPPNGIIDYVLSGANFVFVILNLGFIMQDKRREKIDGSC